MKIVKNLIATLLGIGVIFVGGETVGLRTRATSIEAPVPATSIVAITTGVSGDETTTTTDTTAATETERPTALGEGVTDIVTTESPTNSGTNISTTNTDSTGTSVAKETSGTEDISGTTTGISAWYETGTTTETIKGGTIAVIAGTSQVATNSTGFITTTTSTTTTSINGAPKTSDPSGLGAVCMLVAAGIIGGFLMVNGKKE